MFKTLSKISKLYLKSNPLIRSELIEFSKRNFTNKDEAFWEEYRKRKAQGGRVPALESQDIILNKTVHSWKFANKHSLTAEELLVSLRELDNKSEAPFVILDVREESEKELYQFPLKTKKGALIPIIYREMNEINYGNFQDISLDKYIIIIDSIGLRARSASRTLLSEGYLTLYVEGGYDCLVPLIHSKEF